MSFIGNNIRKIRGVKNLNQSAFAELFVLKRASVGAYEEGRAEPKIKTIIDIAKHFGISIDDLLTKELSVNDLYKFDIFREDLISNSKNNLTPSTPSIDIIPIPFVPSSLIEEYLHEKASSDFINKLDSLYIPMAKGGNYRAFEVNDNSMTHNGFGTGKSDVILCKRPKNVKKAKPQLSKLYLFETENEIWFRKLESIEEDTYILSPLNPNYYDHQLKISEITRIWQVNTIITNNIGNQQDFAIKLQTLENQILAIQSHLKS